MLEKLDDYDWEHVFRYAEKPEPVLNYKGSLKGFSREDVKTIFAMSDGENDRLNWVGVFLLNDGRYAYVEAGCDYTGWGCQEGGNSWVAPDFEKLWLYGLSEEARERLEDAMLLHLAGVM